MNSKKTLNQSESNTGREPTNKPMKKILSSDIAFIAKKTNLSRNKASLLIEKERDLNLVLNEISKTVTQEEAQCLNSNLYHRICVYKYSQSRDFDIDEKTYVADAIFAHLPKIQKKSLKSVSVGAKPTEQSSQYLLVAKGVKKAKINPNAIDAGFRVNGRRDIANHLDEWLDILTKISLSGWLEENSVIRGDEKSNPSFADSCTNMPC
jgi:hypothetical protein